MTAYEIRRILDLHYINYTIGRDPETTWAAEAWTDKNGGYHEDMVNVTGWNKKQLLDWLGY